MKNKLKLACTQAMEKNKNGKSAQKWKATFGKIEEKDNNNKNE